jgi:glycosyltransferase involved in cell wall biosynthesis
MKILEMLGFGTIGVTASGAVANMVCELSNSFAQLGHDVAVADVRSERERKLLDSRVKLCEVDVPSPLDTEIRPKHFLDRLSRKALSFTSLSPHYRYLCSLMANYRYVRGVASNLRFEDYDIIHANHGQQAFFLLKRYHRPYVYTNHWQYSVDDNSWDARIEKMVIRGASTAVASGSYLQSFEPSATHAVIASGIDPEKWKPFGRRACREILGIPESDFVLVFVGNVEYRKGVDLLLKAVENLTDQHKRFRLYLIGSLSRHKYSADVEGHLSHNKSFGDVTDYARTLMEQSKGRPICFLGFMDNMSLEFRRYLSAADVFVLPSRSEAQGLVVLEALAMGIPVVASDVGGLAEMITDDVGYTFPSEDTDRLARILQHLCSDSAHLETLQRNCRDYVEKHYSWKSVALRYIDVFAHCIAPDGPRPKR